MKRLGRIARRLFQGLGLWLLVVVFFQAAGLPVGELAPELKVDKAAFVGLGVVVGLVVMLVYLLIPLFRRRSAESAPLAERSGGSRHLVMTGLRVFAAWLALPVVGALGVVPMIAVDNLFLGQADVCRSVRFGGLGLTAVVVAFLLLLPWLVRRFPRWALVALFPAYLVAWAAVGWLSYEPAHDLRRSFEQAVKRDVATDVRPAAAAVDLLVRFTPGMTFTMITTSEATTVGSRGGCARSIGRSVTSVEETSQFTVKRVARDGTASIEGRLVNLRMKQIIDGRIDVQFDTRDRSSLRAAEEKGVFEPALLDAIVDIDWEPTGQARVRSIRNVPPETASTLRRVYENRGWFDRASFPANPVRAGETWPAGDRTHYATDVTGRYKYKQTGEFRGMGDGSNRNLAYLQYRSSEGRPVEDPDRRTTGSVEALYNAAEITFAVDRRFPESSAGAIWIRARRTDPSMGSVLLETLSHSRTQWR